MTDHWKVKLKFSEKNLPQLLFAHYQPLLNVMGSGFGPLW
jgi:hypothetical protein